MLRRAVAQQQQQRFLEQQEQEQVTSPSSPQFLQVGKAPQTDQSAFSLAKQFERIEREGSPWLSGTSDQEKRRPVGVISPTLLQKIVQSDVFSPMFSRRKLTQSPSPATATLSRASPPTHASPSTLRVTTATMAAKASLVLRERERETHSNATSSYTPFSVSEFMPSSSSSASASPKFFKSASVPFGGANASVTTASPAQFCTRAQQQQANFNVDSSAKGDINMNLQVNDAAQPVVEVVEQEERKSEQLDCTFFFSSPSGSQRAIRSQANINLDLCCGEQQMMSSKEELPTISVIPPPGQSRSPAAMGQSAAGKQADQSNESPPAPSPSERARPLFDSPMGIGVRDLPRGDVFQAWGNQLFVRWKAKQEVESRQRERVQQIQLQKQRQATQQTQVQAQTGTPTQQSERLIGETNRGNREGFVAEEADASMSVFSLMHPVVRKFEVSREPAKADEEKQREKEKSAREEQEKDKKTEEEEKEVEMKEEEEKEDDPSEEGEQEQEQEEEEEEKEGENDQDEEADEEAESEEEEQEGDKECGERPAEPKKVEEEGMSEVEQHVEHDMAVGQGLSPAGRPVTFEIRASLVSSRPSSPSEDENTVPVPQNTPKMAHPRPMQSPSMLAKLPAHRFMKPASPSAMNREIRAVNRPPIPRGLSGSAATARALNARPALPTTALLQKINRAQFYSPGVSRIANPEAIIKHKVEEHLLNPNPAETHAPPPSPNSMNRLLAVSHKHPSIFGSDQNARRASNLQPPRPAANQQQATSLLLVPPPAPQMPQNMSLAARRLNRSPFNSPGPVSRTCLKPTGGLSAIMMLPGADPSKKR